MKKINILFWILIIGMMFALLKVNILSSDLNPTKVSAATGKVRYCYTKVQLGLAQILVQIPCTGVETKKCDSTVSVGQVCYQEIDSIEGSNSPKYCNDTGVANGASCIDTCTHTLTSKIPADSLDPPPVCEPKNEGETCFDRQSCTFKTNTDGFTIQTTPVCPSTTNVSYLCVYYDPYTGKWLVHYPDTAPRPEDVKNCSDPTLIEGQWCYDTNTQQVIKKQANLGWDLPLKLCNNPATLIFDTCTDPTTGLATVKGDNGWKSPNDNQVHALGIFKKKPPQLDETWQYTLVDNQAQTQPFEVRWNEANVKASGDKNNRQYVSNAVAYTMNNFLQIPGVKWNPQYVNLIIDDNLPGDNAYYTTGTKNIAISRSFYNDFVSNRTPAITNLLIHEITHYFDWEGDNGLVATYGQQAYKDLWVVEGRAEYVAATYNGYTLKWIYDGYDYTYHNDYEVDLKIEPHALGWHVAKSVLIDRINYDNGATVIPDTGDSGLNTHTILNYLAQASTDSRKSLITEELFNKPILPNFRVSSVNPTSITLSWNPNQQTAQVNSVSKVLGATNTNYTINYSQLSSSAQLYKQGGTCVYSQDGKFYDEKRPNDNQYPPVLDNDPSDVGVDCFEGICTNDPSSTDPDKQICSFNHNCQFIPGKSLVKVVSCPGEGSNKQQVTTTSSSVTVSNLSPNTTYAFNLYGAPLWASLKTSPNLAVAQDAKDSKVLGVAANPNQILLGSLTASTASSSASVPTTVVGGFCSVPTGSTFYCQFDPKWGGQSAPGAGCDIATGGCGPTTAAMVLSRTGYMTFPNQNTWGRDRGNLVDITQEKGKDLRGQVTNPLNVDYLFVGQGWRSPGYGCGSDMLGFLNWLTTIGYTVAKVANGTPNINDLASAYHDGYLMVVSVNNYPMATGGTVGHIFGISAVDTTTNTLTLFDPANCATNSDTKQSFATVTSWGWNYVYKVKRN